jgi:hypothetical protein
MPTGNEGFVNEQNDLVRDFQTKNIELCIKYCTLRIEAVTETILKYKSNYTNENNLDDKLEKIKNDTEKLLKKDFDESHRVIANYSPVYRKVLVKTSHNDSSFRHDNSFQSNRRNKRDRSLNNNSYSKYYNRNKKARGNNHNNNSRNSINTSQRGRNNYNSTPSRNNSSHSHARSQSRS